MIDLASSIQSDKKFIIFGGGFSGKFFAKAIRKLGYTALTSSRTKKNDPYSFIFDSENKIYPKDEIFDGTTHILSCIPPDKEGNDPVLKSLRSKIESLSIDWAGYLSTTGVYGNSHGNWVFENDEPNPIQERSKKRLNCEKQWIDSNIPIQIFRLPGIYGPGRSSLDAIQKNKIRIIHKENQVFSRIHVADITGAIIYLINNKSKLDFCQIINIADDEPCSQVEVLEYCHKLLGLKMPKPILFKDAKKDLSSIAQSFWFENRRVSNKLLCKKLGYKLIYKNYKLGLHNCLINIK